MSLIMHVGGQAVNAKEMTLGEYNQLKGWTIPNGEDPTTPGFYYEVQNGHASWMPADIFNDVYQKNGSLSWGSAAWLLERGHAVKRSGWNGTNMFILMDRPRHFGLKIDGLITMFNRNPRFMIFNVTKQEESSWVPSSTDLVAKDWEVILIEKFQIVE